MVKTNQSPPTWHDGIALVRIVFGALLSYHGWQMFIGREVVDLSAWIVNDELREVLSFAIPAMEMLGGGLLVLGLFTRLTTILLCAGFSAAFFTLGNGDILARDQTLFLLALISLTFFFAGAGRLSVDYVLFLNRRAHTEREELNRFGRYVSR